MMSSSHHTPSFAVNDTRRGQIQVIFGPMFSGKTTELIRRMKRYQIANYSCMIIKYSKDDRYEKNGIATHDRQTLPAISAEKLNTLFTKAMQYDVLGIDEGQFFPDVVEFSNQLAESGKVVIVAALDGTFQKQGFGNILNLVPIAEHVTKLTAVCMNCYSEASFTKRKGSEKKVEVIGGADKYLAVCRTCFQSPIKESPRKRSPLKDINNPLQTTIQENNVAIRKLFLSPEIMH